MMEGSVVLSRSHLCFAVDHVGVTNVKVCALCCVAVFVAATLYYTDKSITPFRAEKTFIARAYMD